MSSDKSKDADNPKREQRQRRIRIIVGLFMLMLGVPPSGAGPTERTRQVQRNDVHRAIGDLLVIIHQGAVRGGLVVVLRRIVGQGHAFVFSPKI